MSQNNITPGIHPLVSFEHFSVAEKEIIKIISKEWYITNDGEVINLGRTSFYRYILIKPTEKYHRMFNLSREIVVVFSRYNEFEPRTLDTYDWIFFKHQSLRLENICTILVSRDNQISYRLSNLLKSDPESRIIIPFSYDELITNKDDTYMMNKFRNKFYSRDLFAFQAPIKKEIFFFGRNELVLEIVNRHRTGENSGLFGLRKTGKTSVIFGIKRTLQKLNESSVFIDCQNPSFHKKRWNKALYYIISEIKVQNNIDVRTYAEDSYTEDEASTRFERDIIKIYNNNDKKSILLVFDEIENITMGISPSKHWTDDYDFVLLWQTVRSLFQKFILHQSSNVFTFLIVGTNPKCIETPTIHNSDNPIFNKIPYQYIKGFNVTQTKEMVKMLGGYMGLSFDEIIFAKLTEEFGGHPFLIRHVCSLINKLCPKERPIRVDKTIYERAKIRFNDEYHTYIEMILNVLKDFYKDEYEMLMYLALEDMEAFDGLATEFPELTSHLKGYNIIDSNLSNYTFSIEAVKEYLVKRNKYKKIHNSDTERWQEICERRNDLEVNLRILIKRQLQISYGKNGAMTKVLDIMGNPRKTKYSGKAYSDLFNPNIVEIYLNDLIKLISKNYSDFKNIFGLDQKDTLRKLEAINEYRVDAHAKAINNDDMNYFRVCMSSMESKIEDFI